MGNISITLDQAEIMLARTMATFRSGLNRLNGTVNPKFKESDEYMNDLIGVCGEMVFAKQFNVYMDMSFQPRSGGHDFVMNSGKTVDIKTTEYDNGRLIVPKWKDDKRSDIYVLVTGQLPTFTIR